MTDRPSRSGRRLAVALGALAVALLLSTLLRDADPLRQGRAAFAAERWDAALAAFASAEHAAADRAGPDLLEARALAALHALALRDAEACAEKLLVRGGERSAGRRAFLLGTASYSRALRASAEADLPGGDPTALDRGVDHARRALTWLKDAAHTGRDATRPGNWPLAVRNAERAAALYDNLRARRDQRDQQQQQQPPQPQEQELQIPEPQRPDDEDPAEGDERDRATLQQLLDRLAAREKEKSDLRDALRDRRSQNVEADW